MLLVLILGALLALSQALPHGTLTTHQIAEAKKRCQANCVHVPANGRGIVLHNRCVQTCWNEFFQSMTKPEHEQQQQQQQHQQQLPVFHNLAGTKQSILNSGHNRMVRTAASNLAYTGVMIFGVLGLGVAFL